MTTFMRQFLQNLCAKSPWDYAVFWKIQHHCPVVLTWEDGYFDIPTVIGTRYLIDNYYQKGFNEALSPNCESISDNGYFGEHTIVSAIAEMSNTCHIAGKGVIGHVASSSVPHWIFSDSVAAAGLSSASIAECPDEWQLQFSAGIKTILLVPCISHGVLQLGSVKKVVENVNVVMHLVAEFDAYFKFVENSSCRKSSALVQQSSGQIATPSENLDKSSVSTAKVKDHIVADIPQNNHKIPTTSQMTSLLEVHDSSHLSGKLVPNVLESTSESNIPMQLKHQHSNVNKSEITGNIVEQLKHQSSNDNKSATTGNSLSRSFQRKHLDDFSYCSSSSVLFCGIDAFDGLDFHFIEDPQSLEMYSRGSVSNSLSFPRECELHKVLGHAVQDHANHYLDGLSGVSDNTTTASILTGDYMPSLGESNEWCLKADDIENLLEAVVASGCCISDDYSSYKSIGPESSDTSLGKTAPFPKRKNQFVESASVVDITVSRSRITCPVDITDKNSLGNPLHAASSSDRVASALGESQQQKNVLGALGHGEESKFSNTNKKRGRPGDGPRPRPRDRQLIQDRINELRELVPNGAGLSIDGLLDKTIKHMLFLRSVTNQADKLRYQAKKEVSPEKSQESLKVKIGNQQGTCWALEMGSEDQICPIFVKDLEYPGHMLIEMLCDDHGRFLEIADVIHRLELTILKGIMEKHFNNTWAHFVVEASGSVQRLDIFWPLMQILQQGRCNISSKMLIYQQLEET